MGHKANPIIFLIGKILLYVSFLFTVTLTTVYAEIENLISNDIWASSQQYSPDNYENDNRHGYKSAQVIVIDDTVSQQHNFHKTGDVDWVKFYGLANTSYRIEVLNPGTKCDAVIELYDTDGTTLLKIKDDYLGGGAETLDYTPSKEGIYYVKLSNYTPAVYGADTNYDIKVWKPTAPSFIGILTGIVSDSSTNAPIRNAVVKTNHMGSSLTNKRGSYTLIEEQGNWTLTVNALGYQSFSQNVSIAPGMNTLNIKMTPSVSVIIDQLSTPFSPPDNEAEEELFPSTSYGSALNGIIYSTNIFVAAGDYGTLTASPDGISWTDRSSSTDYELYGITYGNNTYVSVGDYGSILTSADSILWIRATSNTTNHLYGVTYGNGLFVAVGERGKILSSTNGNNWTDKSYSTNDALYGITYGSGLFVAVGDKRKILTSPDGNNWTDRSLSTSSALYGVTYGNSLFVAIGEYGLILTSSDGTVWTNRSVSSSYELYAIAYGNGIFTAAGDSGKLLSSDDTMNWTEESSYTDKGLYGIAYGNRAFVAVGDQQIILLPDNPFSDVPSGYWAENYILAIYNAHITTGCSQNPLKYCPEDNVTREQMAAFIVRAKEGEPASNYCDSGLPFTDVTSTMWSCKYIKRLKELGVTTGYGDGRYGPLDTVTREQMAAFIVRAKEGEPAANYCSTGSSFPDVDVSSWSCKYIKRLKELGVTTGYGDGRYGPLDMVTRAQMAAFIARAFLGMQ